MSDKVIRFDQGRTPRPRKPQSPPPEPQAGPRVVVEGMVKGPCHGRKAALLRAEGLTGGAVWLTLGLPGAEAPWTMLRGDYCAVYGPAEVRVRDEETGVESDPVVVGVEPEGGATQ